jgi:DNA-binding MarR family transcriptional regulator
MFCQAVMMNENIPMINQNIVSLAICYQHLSDRINRAVEPFQLNMTRFSILNHFAWQPERSHTISDLTKAMEMNQSALTKAVKAMTMQNWIRKQRDKDDARVTHLFITDLGLNQLDKARQACFPLITGVFAEFNAEELADMNRMLNKLKSQLDPT